MVVVVEMLQMVVMGVGEELVEEEREAGVGTKVLEEEEEELAFLELVLMD
jgi:hypothetical protein